MANIEVNKNNKSEEGKKLLYRFKNGRPKKLWIAWEKHRRTSELAKALNDVKVFQFELDAPRLIRYIYLLYKTIVILIIERPELVIVQNPSVVLALFMTTIGRLFTSYVVVDAHNSGLKPFYRRFYWMLPVYKLIQKMADLTIVTNKELATEVLKNGGVPFVLEDKIPVFSSKNKVKLRGRYNLVLICTFEKDEPYNEVIQAANAVDPSIYLYFTGNYLKAPPEIIEKAPSNVIFTGFLSDQEYKKLLYSCDIIIDLTFMENCLVCGAYEAVALEKPLILSDTPVLRRYFDFGVTYTENTSEAIAESIKFSIVNKTRLDEDIKKLKKRLVSEWNIKFSKLSLTIDRSISNGTTFVQNLLYFSTAIWPVIFEVSSF